MFPNFRLTIVAVLASVVGIGCGLGLFAAFRVNHEPLAGLSNGKPPLQLAFDSVEPLGGNAAPFGIRFQVNAPAAIVEPVVVMQPPPPLPQPAEVAPADDDSHSPDAPAASTEGTTVAPDRVAIGTPMGEPPPAVVLGKPAPAPPIAASATTARATHKPASRRRVVRRVRRQPPRIATQPADQNFFGAPQGLTDSPQTAQPSAATKRTRG